MDTSLPPRRASLVLVANGAYGRLLRIHRSGIDELRRFTSPHSRERERQLGTDRPGRYQAGLVHPAIRGSAYAPRSGFGPAHGLRDHAADLYAREIAAELGLQLRSWPADGVVLIAPPVLLGRVRAHLGHAVLRHVRRSVPHDYTRLATLRIPEAIRDPRNLRA
jgi:protein required for attachment to host cells